MRKSSFILEMDVGLGEAPNAAAKGAAGEEHGPPNSETPLLKDAPPSPWNLNSNTGLVKPDDPNRSERDHLFQAVVAGDPEELNGLSEYLRGTSSFLTDPKYRDGKTGKTCLMKALLYLKDGKNPTIPVLLRIDKETKNPEPLVNATCTDSYYKGQTALHIAIEKRNVDLVKLLVENGADVHVKASHLSFQQDCKGVHFYLGELPLSLAACTNQQDIVKYLLDNPHQKARLTEQDSMGNTVLHALVMVANDTEKNTEFLVDMYDMILMKGAEMDPASKLEAIKNRERLTPLTLAVKTGKVEILKHMLSRQMKDPKFRQLSRKFTERTYGPIHVSLYDLTSIDSCEENSALEILAYSSDTPNRHQMVVLEPLNQLLQHKWKSFIRKRFFFSLFVYLIFTTIFTATACYWPSKEELLVPTTTMIIKDLTFLGGVVVLIGGVYLFIAQSVHFWRRRFYLKGLRMESCFDTFLFLQAFAILLSSGMYVAKSKFYVVPTVLALLLGWVNLLYYAHGLQETGIYIVMILKTFLWDLSKFVMVYVILLLGFAAALIVLTGGVFHPGHNESITVSNDSKEQAMYSGLLRTSLMLFSLTIGMGDLQYKKRVKQSHFAMALVLLFVILTYILLLNMLIALMSETVSKVTQHSKGVWQLQRAIAIVDMEKSWIWYWKKPKRAGCYRSIGSEDKEDRRRFFRVEELHWEDLTEKGVLREEPTDTLSLEESPGSKIRSLLSQALSRLTPSGEQKGEKEERAPMKNLRP